jgi:type IV conjugative transfer system protein TraL
MDLTEHRVYKHLSSPFRVIGLTIDELMMGLSGFVAFFLIQNKFFGGMILGLSIFGVFIWKKIKKQAAGFSFMSFVNWYFGGNIAQIGSYWPQSHERRWLV